MSSNAAVHLVGIGVRHMISVEARASTATWRDPTRHVYRRLTPHCTPHCGYVLGNEMTEERRTDGRLLCTGAHDGCAHVAEHDTTRHTAKEFPCGIGSSIASMVCRGADAPSPARIPTSRSTTRSSDGGGRPSVTPRCATVGSTSSGPRTREPRPTSLGGGSANPKFSPGGPPRLPLKSRQSQDLPRRANR